MTGLPKILSQEGAGALYAGFGPILFKQIPYTMAKFAVFEMVSEKAISAYGKPKAELSGAESNSINLGCGLVAGMASAVISQPADTLLSKINKTQAKAGESTTSRLVGLAGQLGLGGMFSGIGTRLVMVGGITAVSSYLMCITLPLNTPFTGSIRPQRFLQGPHERQGWCRNLQVDLTLDFNSFSTYILFTLILVLLCFCRG